jgi:hypothetical protein
VAPSALTAGFADCWFLGSRQRIFFQKLFADWPPARQSAKKENIFFEMFFADCFLSCRLLVPRQQIALSNISFFLTRHSATSVNTSKK